MHHNILRRPKAIRRIAHRYRRGGVAGAVFEGPRPGATEVLTASDKQRIIPMVCSAPPAGAARWTVRLVAGEAGKRQLVPRVGRETIRLLLQSHDLNPWREKMWCVAELTPAYIVQMEDVLAFYEKPYGLKEPAVCGDENPVSLHPVGDKQLQSAHDRERRRRTAPSPI